MDDRLDGLEVDSTNVNALALLFLVAMCVVMLQARRTAAVQALLAVAAFLPLGQQIVLFGLHFQFYRILLVIGYVRVTNRGETRSFRLNQLDKLFIAWAVTEAICGAFREPGAIMGGYCLGGAFNAFGTYFLVRFLTKDPTEVLEHIRFLAVAAIVVALAMSYEFMVHRNLFAVFGGVSEFTLEREGRFRAQGPFRHPILAGTFQATLFPLLFGLSLRGGRDKTLAYLGMTASIFASCVAAASSGALLTCAMAAVGLALWPIRERMYLIRRGIVLLLIGFAMVMKAPVWYLIARLSDLFGGGGWHRAYLIDQAVSHLGEWWLIGTSVTAHWAPGGQVLAVDPNNMDITNHFVLQAVHGGILGLGLFVANIAGCFKMIGRGVRPRMGSPLNPVLLWTLGVSLACHCMAFISISYFDQIEVFWFWLLAMIAAVAGCGQREAASRPRPRSREYATTTQTPAVPQAT